MPLLWHIQKFFLHLQNTIKIRILILFLQLFKTAHLQILPIVFLSW